MTNNLEQQTDLSFIELALDVILQSESLEDLCQRAVTNPATNQIFDGAHVLLNSQGGLTYDSGYGHGLPDTHQEIALVAITNQAIEFRPESSNSPAMIAVPFISNDITEAVGILILAPGVNYNYLQGQLEPILTRLTGFYLVTTYGTGN